MEWEGLPYPACEIPHDISCFALSPDKKMMAGGKGNFISFFDACSLVKVFGPIKVIEAGDDINQLKFSPDGKFVFFGRLDKWLSVEKRCVEEFPQFSENCICYKWASFVWGGRVIVLQRDHPGRGKHTWSCLINIFFSWATQELNRMQRMQSNESAFSCYMEERGSHEVIALLNFVRVLERKGIIDVQLCSELVSIIRCLAHFSLGEFCQECRQFEQNKRETTLSVVRKRVIDLYSEIFEYQVWDVQSGRPVLEEAFSSDVVLSPFTYLCHMATAVGGNKALLSVIDKESLSFCNVAFINLVYCLPSFLAFRAVRFSSFFDESFWRDSFFVTNLPIEFLNRLAMKYSRLSLDGKWIAVRQSCFTPQSDYMMVSLFEKRNLEHFDFGKPVHIIKDAEQFAFTDDSCGFLYVTVHRSLHALSLQTGTILSSASGFIPLYCTPEEHVGYFFHGRGEEKIILARQFPRSFLSLFSIPSHQTPLAVAFTSADTIRTLYSDGTLACWQTSGVDGSFALGTQSRLRASFSNGIYAKKAVSSPDGKLIATHGETEILLFGKVLHSVFFGKCDFKLLYFVFVGECEYIISCLTFSPDSSLFLYCIPCTNNQPRFYVWMFKRRLCQQLLTRL